MSLYKTIPGLILTLSNINACCHRVSSTAKKAQGAFSFPNKSPNILLQPFNIHLQLSIISHTAQAQFTYHIKMKCFSSYL